MKLFLAILVLVHGFIHFAGFLKGFALKDLKELTLPISKAFGLAWLGAGIMVLTFAVLFLLHSRYAWAAGFAALLVSQFLVIWFWKDARPGTIPNLLLLLLSLASLGKYRFERMVERETLQILGQYKNSSAVSLMEEDLAGLPKPVKNWLKTSGALGKQRGGYGMIIQAAELKLKPEQKEWWKANAIQYSTLDIPGFIWTVEVKMNDFIRFRGRDKFEDGKGSMLIKFNSILNVVNEKGSKLDEGTLQRYLGEMVWFPSLALSPFISWEPINDTTARATMRYKGTEGSGIFSFNSKGEVIRFSALRFMGNAADSKRLGWEMNISGWKTFDGIKVPSEMTSTWKLDSGDWTWLKLEVRDIRYHAGAGS
jgi:hypothetical protein